MAMYYARNSHQELIMMQSDLEKAYNYVNWSFVSGLMHTMGIGPCVSCLIFLLGQDALSQVMLMGSIKYCPHNIHSFKDALIVHYCMRFLLIPC